MASRLDPDYRAQKVIITVYDGVNPKREENIKELTSLLAAVGDVQLVGARHIDPVENVNQTVALLGDHLGDSQCRILVDTSTYTRKHLVQLLFGLDSSGLLGNATLLYSEPSDYHTADNEPISKGIQSVRAIEGLTGTNRPSRGSLLVLFLGYEGTRALALWDHLEPSEAILVIEDPPSRVEWAGRVEAQNRYLLSVVPQDRVLRCSGNDPEATEALLEKIWSDLCATNQPPDLHIAPLGSQAQLVGIYRFWRKRPGVASLMYASPDKYRSDRDEFEPTKVTLLASTVDWPVLVLPN